MVGGTVGIALPYLTTLDDLIEAIAERVATKINSAPARIYTTNKRGPHIPGKSRRWMLTHVKTMAGARKVGRDWEIDISDYEAWASTEDARRCAENGRARPDTAVELNFSDPADDLARRAACSLDAQGYRRTR